MNKVLIAIVAVVLAVALHLVLFPGIFAFVAPIKAEASQMKTLSGIGLLIGLVIFWWIRNADRQAEVKPPDQSIPESHEFGD